MSEQRLAIMPLRDAKELQDQLKNLGVEIILNHNDETCTRGCAVTVEVLGFEKDFPIISKIYSENFKKLTEGHEVDWNQMNSVYDPTKAEAVCPACGTSFETTNKECPECGLVLG